MVCISTLGARENSIVALEEQFWEPWACSPFSPADLLEVQPAFTQASIFSTCLAMLLIFCCEPLYSSVTPLVRYWVRFIMATRVNYSSLELIVAFSVFVNAIFAGDGLIYVLCSGEYFECAILLDRLYLGVSSMHLDILFPDTVMWLDIFTWSSARRLRVFQFVLYIRNIGFNLRFAPLRLFFLWSRPG